MWWSISLLKTAVICDSVISELFNISSLEFFFLSNHTKWILLDWPHLLSYYLVKAFVLKCWRFMCLFQKLFFFYLLDGLLSWNHQWEVSSSKENLSHKAPFEPALHIWIMLAPPPHHFYGSWRVPGWPVIGEPLTPWWVPKTPSSNEKVNLYISNIPTSPSGSF